MAKEFCVVMSIGWYFFFMGTILGNWAAIIPKVQDMHNLNNGELGGLMCGVVFGAMLVIPIVTTLIEKYGSARTTPLGGIIFVVTYPVIGIPGNIGFLICGLILLGFSAGFQDISMNGQAVLHEKSTKKACLGLFTSLFAVGTIFGALSGGAMLGPFNLSVLKQSMIISLVTLPPTIIASCFLYSFDDEKLITKSSPVVHIDHARNTATSDGLIDDDQAKPLLTDDMDESSPTITSLSKDAHSRSIEEGTDNDDLVTEPVDSTMLTITCVLCFIAYFGEGSVGDWSAIFLTSHGASPFQSTFGIAAFQLFVAFGRFYSDYLVMSIGRRTLLRLSGVCSASGLLLVSISPLFSQLNLFLITVVAGFALCGAGMAVVYPTVISIAGSCIRGMKPSEAIAYVSSVGYIGVMVGPPVIGGLSLLVGLQISFVMDAALLCGMSVIANFLPT
jgi:MFS family permease